MESDDMEAVRTESVEGMEILEYGEEGQIVSESEADLVEELNEDNEKQANG